MPSATLPLQITPLSHDVRKFSQIGAEIQLPTSMPLFDVDSLTKEEKDTLRQGLYEHGVLVVHNQSGISPSELLKICRLFDNTALDVHSGGKSAMTDPKNILAANKQARHPRADQVTIIGQGQFENYEGLRGLNLKHVVCYTRYGIHFRC